MGAAVVTVLVILGVFAGPGVVSCFNAPDGMGQCLQSRLRDVGLLPAGAAPQQVEASVAPSTPAVPAPAQEAAETALVEPELDIVPADAAAAAALAAPDSLVAASFGLLRAEPDGSVVIAGSGRPGSEIEIFANGMLLGKSTVASSGDWVFVPDVRIAPGGTEITLGETGKKGLAPESFVVAINEDKTSEPLVVASTPGAASQVLQGLPSAPAEDTTELAALDGAVPAAAASMSATATAPASPAIASAPEAPPTPPAPAAMQPAAPADPAPIPAAETASSAAPPPVAAPPAATPPAAVPPAAVAAAPEPSVPAAPPEPAMAVASATPAAPSTPVAAVPDNVVPPTIDAVEVEGDRSFFAGSGTDGTTVRLYVDDIFIADTLVSSGRWLIEAGKVLTRPSQRVRIDMLQAGSGDVLARAEVDFSIELPADNTAVAATEPAPSAPPVEVAAAPAPGPAAATEAPAPDVPTMVAVSIGNVDDQRFAAGKAIIRRGDNLWTIARRAYGEGIKYTTIYALVSHTIS